MTTEEMTLLKVIPISQLGLTFRALGVARRAGFASALDVASASRSQLRSTKNCGSRTVDELRQAVKGSLEPTETVCVDVKNPAALQAYVESLLARLDSRSQHVLRARFGLWDGHQETLQQIATELSLSRERIRQIEKKAFAPPVGVNGNGPLQVMCQLRDGLFEQESPAGVGGVMTAVDIAALRGLATRSRPHGAIVGATALRFLVAVFDSNLVRFKMGLVSDLQERWFRNETFATRFNELERRIQIRLVAQGRMWGWTK